MPGAATWSAPPPLIALWHNMVEDTRAEELPSLGEREVDWIIQTGMAALYVDTAEGYDASRTPDRLRASARWAQLHHADMMEAACEVLDACADRAPPLTLLKGISTGPELYRKPHQRFLGDLDLLAPREAVGPIQAALEGLGYLPEQSSTDYRTHHHLRPLQHPRTGVWIELHTELFPETSGLCGSGPFEPSQIEAERRTSLLDGRAVYRLSPELQVAYIASHWASDFSPATGARALLDMLLLLRAGEREMDWERVVSWLEDRRIAAHLQLMLGCLEAWGLLEIPAPLRAHWETSPVLEPNVLDVLIGMAERYQVRGAMAAVSPLPPKSGESTGTLRSRVGTLRASLATGNWRGLLPIIDSVAWTRLLDTARSPWRTPLTHWCRLFPPGDPHRFVVGKPSVGAHSAATVREPETP